MPYIRTRQQEVLTDISLKKQLYDYNRDINVLTEVGIPDKLENIKQQFGGYNNSGWSSAPEEAKLTAD